MAACIGILGGANKIISVLFAIMAAGAAYYIFRQIYRRKTNNLRRDLRNSTRRCEDIEDHIENIESNYDFSFIPNGYRNREAMMHFYRSLITGRAYNLKQAIVYYDEYLEREEEKQRQEDQIRMQQRQIDELKRMNESNRVTQNSSNDLGPILTLGGALLFGTKVLKDIRRFMK